jgi:hypothetical protein
MSAQLRSLIWREFHERKLPLALCTAWIVGGVVYAVANELAYGYRSPVGGFYATSFLYGLFASVFLAMRTALGEQTQGTLGFSSSLPLSLRTLAWTRLAGGIATLAGPIVLGAVLLSLVLLTGAVEQAQARSLRGLGEYVRLTERASLSSLQAIGLLWALAAVAAAGSIQLFLILSVIGARRRAEAHIGLIGAVVAFVWFLGIGLRGGFRDVQEDGWADWLGALFPQSIVIAAGYGGERGGGYTDPIVAGMVWLPLAVNLLVLTALGAWFTRRYGTLAPLAEGSGASPHRRLGRR